MISDRKVKLSDIAAECGVGSSTVSRVLNGFSNGFSVKPEMRQQILAAARRLNYVPNATARNLRACRTMNILIFGFRFSWTAQTSVYGPMLEECTDVLNGKGYMVNAVFCDINRLEFAPLLADGAILLTAMDQALLAKLRRERMPFVVLNDALGEEDCWIDLDDADGARQAMAHLLRRGHRRIAYCGPVGDVIHNHHKSIYIRRETYRGMMREAGLEILEIPDWTDAVTAGKQLLAWNCTAMLGYCYNHSHEIQNVLEAVGRRVPGDFEIAAFDQSLSELDHDLTLIHPPEGEIGRYAAQLLLERIENGAVGHKVFQHQLYPAKIQ